MIENKPELLDQVIQIIRIKYYVERMEDSFINWKKGTDFRYIHELLGHGSPKTIETYTHVSQRVIDKIKNPIVVYFEGLF